MDGAAWYPIASAVGLPRITVNVPHRFKHCHRSSQIAGSSGRTLLSGQDAVDFPLEFQS